MIIKIVKFIFNFIFGNVKLILFKILFFKKFEFSINNRISFFSTLCITGNGKIKIGSNCRINKQCEISSTDGEIIIGDRCFFNNNCQIVSKDSIVIGEDVIVGPNLVMVDHDHSFSTNGINKKKFTTAKIHIGNNVWIGANVVILKNTKIGDNCVIGAGSVVSGEIPSNTIFVQKRCNNLKEMR